MQDVESQVKSTIFARFFEDEDLLKSIAATAKKYAVDSGWFHLIGTLKEAVLGFYEAGKYLPIKKPGPLEIVSCHGNISMKEQEELVVHAHIVVSNSTGDAFGGHVLPGCLVDATAEIVLVEAEKGTLRRELDPEKNLHLLALE